MDNNLIKMYEIVENMIYDFYCNKTVNEIINTRTEATEIERHLRKVFIYHISEFLEKTKVEENKPKEEKFDHSRHIEESQIKLPKF